MILAIDIGNTNTHLAFFSNPEKIIASESIANTSLNITFLGKVLKMHAGKQIISKIKTVLMCSTNPEIEPIINEWSKNVFKIKPLKVGRDFDVPIANRTDAPAKVGKDRLLNALAARKIVPGHKPIIVISCGTAITFDIVSHKGEFLGGAIAPGISMMAKALYQNCALLPWVKLPSKKPVALGRNTQDAIISGVYFGGSGLVRNIIHELVKTLKIKPSGVRIILTGGDAELVNSALPLKGKIIPDLTLRGLVWAYLSKSKT
jgi:type III pantothenate kinase